MTHHSHRPKRVLASMAVKAQQCPFSSLVALKKPERIAWCIEFAEFCHVRFFLFRSQANDGMVTRPIVENAEHICQRRPQLRLSGRGRVGLCACAHRSSVQPVRQASGRRVSSPVLCTAHPLERYHCPNFRARSKIAASLASCLICLSGMDQRLRSCFTSWLLRPATLSAVHICKLARHLICLTGSLIACKIA